MSHGSIWSFGLTLARWRSRVRFEVAIVLISRLVSMGAGLVFVLLTARHLGPAGRGEITLAFTVAWGTTSLANLGTPTSGRVRLLNSENSIGPRDILSLTLALIPLQTVLSAASVLAISRTSVSLSWRLSLVVVVLSVATMMFSSVVMVCYGLRRYRTVLLAELSVAVVEVLVLLVLLSIARLTTVTAVATMAMGLSVGAVGMASRLGVAHRSKKDAVGRKWRTLIVEGRSPLAGAVSHFLALRVSRLVLAVTVSAHSLGLFTVALAIPEALRVIPKAFGQVVADRGRSGVDPVRVAHRHIRLFLLGYSLVLLFAFLVGSFLVPVVFGPGFSAASDVLGVVIAAEFLFAIHLKNHALLVGYCRIASVGAPQVLGAVVMVALVLLMIPTWGLEGAAWACLLGYAALAGMSTVWSNRELRRIEA